MSDLPTDPPPAPVRRAPLRDQKWFTVFAACIAGVMMGYGLSGFLPKTPDWKRDAALHHSLYADWTLDGLNPDPDARRAQLMGASGDNDALSPLSDPPPQTGLTFRRAQGLKYKDARLAHIAFTTVDAAPVALFVMERATGAKQADAGVEIVTTRYGDQPASTWSANGLEFALVGGVDALQNGELAAQIAAHLSEAERS